MSDERRRVVVVGGGITGLSTALYLARQTDPDDVEIVVREADDRLGGKLRTTPFGGLPAVDEGADSFLARVPAASQLADDVGLSNELTSPTNAKPAVWFNELHPIPEGLALGVPGDVRHLASSGLLSIRGKLRAALEPLLPRRADAGDSIGRLIRSRFGDEVQDRLVDALIGSIYAADTDRFSLASVPQLATLSGSRSLLLAARRTRAAGPAVAGPIFLAPTQGMAALVDAVAGAARAEGVAIQRRTPVAEIAADGAGWRVDEEPAHDVVLATPAASTAPLLRQGAPEAARLLAAMEHAGVAIVTLRLADWPAPLHHRSGYLVPKPVQRTVTAVSFGSQKWAHWRTADDSEILRISLGRDGLPIDQLDDDQLVERAVDEVGRHLAHDLRPTATRVSRWPAAFPQYRPFHQDWVARVEAALPAGLHVTGASYRGIGVAACIAQAGRTAAVVAARVDRRPATLER